MNIARCPQCGGLALESMTLCPSCLRAGGENTADAAAELLNIANIANMGDTDASQRAAIESILRIKSRLEGNSVETKEKAQAPPI